MSRGSKIAGAFADENGDTRPVTNTSVSVLHSLHSICRVQSQAEGAIFLGGMGMKLEVRAT